MTSKKIIPLLLFLLAQSLLFAQNNEVTITPEAAIQMSLQQSKLLKLDNAKIEAAEAKYFQAKDMLLPSVSINGSYTRLSDNVQPFSIKNPANGTELLLNPQVLNQYTQKLSASQLIYDGGKTQYAIKSLQLLKEAAKFDYEKNRTAIVYNTISAFYNLYKIQQTKKIIEENIVLVKEHVRNIKNFEKNGLALKNDVLKIELHLSNLENSLIEINSSLGIANYNMSILLGSPTGSEFRLETGKFFQLTVSKALDDYISDALINRTDLKAAGRRIDAAILDTRSAKSNYIPTLSAGGNYYYSNPNTRVFPQEENFKGTWDAGLTLRWNVSSLYTNKHQVAENKAITAQKQSAKESLTDDIRMEVNSNYLGWVKNKEKIKVSEQAVAQAEENYRIADNRFKNNTILISDLTDANTLLLQSRISLVVDKADADLSCYKLITSTGITQFYNN